MKKIKATPYPEFKDTEVMASYINSPIPSYKGNPLIEALPPILNRNEAMRLLAYFPEYKEEYRSWDSPLRLHLLLECMDFFTPLKNILDLEQRISLMMRYGYKDRNPFNKGYWKDLDNKVKTIDLIGLLPIKSRSSAKSFTFLGPSGVGKTTAIERILHRLYPPVITHAQYKNKDFNFKQIIWLKLDCPHDGSIKGLCQSFLQAIDEKLETNYFKSYAQSGRTTTYQLIGYMARLARIHCPGILVIDEIQNLSEVKSGGHKQMLNFFVQLINTIDLPIILIGTYKAFPLLTSEFRMMRRGTGQGDMIWNPMKEEENWQVFVKSLWRYQFVKKLSKLTSDLCHTLYYECQGIIDFAVKVFMLAQVRAIESGKEEITIPVIKSAAKDYLATARAFMNALKLSTEDGNWNRLAKYDDIKPIDLEPFLEEYNQKRNSDNKLENETLNLANNINGKEVSLTETSKKNETDKFIAKNLSGKTQVDKKTHAYPYKNSLIEMVKREKNKTSAYQALKQNGYIKNVDEYIVEVE